MARDFDGSTGYLSRGSAVVTAAPLTMACWFNHDGQATLGSLMQIHDNDTNNNRIGIWFRGDQSSILAAITKDGTTTAQANSASSASSGVWHHGAAVFASSASRQAFLDGVGGTPETSNKLPSGLAFTFIGALTTSVSFFNGRIAEAAIWNVALTAAEIASLAQGFSPMLIRPTALALYCPIFGRSSPEIDFKNTAGMSVTGIAPFADHCRTIMPRKRAA